MEPAEYTPEASEYKRTVLSELRRELLDSHDCSSRLRMWGEVHKGVRVEVMRLDDSGVEILILFRDLGRLECLFGFKAPSIEPEQLGPDGAPRDYYTLEDAAVGHANVVRANFEEEIHAAGYGLPADCSPDGVNWL